MLFVKICGIGDAASARAAAQAGADAIGFIFHPPSRRYVPPARAGEIAAAAGIPAGPDGGCTGAGAAGLGAPGAGPARVGVFVDADLREVREAARAAGLHFVQLHGAEPPGFCREARRATGCRVIKALRVGADGRVPSEGWSPGDADYFLLDADVPGQAGGTGRAFDWGAARAVRLPAPVIVAGGLNPDNVAEALAAARPAGVDVSSGVETGGRKDGEKIRAFVARARRWEHEHAGDALPVAR